MHPEVQALQDLASAPIGNDGRGVCTGRFIEHIHDIRLEPSLKPFEKKRAVARVVLDDLKARGQLIRTQENDLYFFDRKSKVLECLKAEDFRSELYERFGLNATEDEPRFVEGEIRTAAMRRGIRAAVHKLASWDEKAKRLYVSGNDGTLFLLDGEGITKADNGTDGVLFLHDRRADLLASREHFDAIFEGLSLAPTTGESAHEETLALLKIWVLAFFS